MKKWIEQAQILKNIAQASDLFARKVTAKEIFGSNHMLTQKNTVVQKNVGENTVGGGHKTQWTAR